MVEKLFSHLLFPPISLTDGNRPKRLNLPILNSATRQNLYNVVLTLSNDMTRCQYLVGLVKGLLPEGEDSQAWSWGIAQVAEDDQYEANWNLERSKLVRSKTGYAGLKNLSNTCYLNSLFTQLFMNVGFRNFMLNANIADSEGTQRLLAETKSLFAHMQESLLKSVDPQGIADSIVTYDNSSIDVSIQMDVDEFYNLLFDRWESQILSESDKKRFRSSMEVKLFNKSSPKNVPISPKDWSHSQPYNVKFVGSDR